VPPRSHYLARNCRASPATAIVPADDDLVEGIRMTNPAALSDRTRRLLEGPILPTLLRLAAPNLGEAAARIAFIGCDAVFVGWLGTDALAGVSLVFPIFLIMQMTSASGLGAGVAAAVARALGGGRRADADALASHAILLAALTAAGFATSMLIDGPALYRALGARGPALAAAVSYSNLVFGGGALAVWLMNILANLVRGTGNMTVPASAIIAGELVHLALSPSLILGWGPFPQLGVAGAALAVIAAYGTGAAILLVYLLSGSGLVRLSRAALRPRLAPVRAILSVGGLAALNVLQWQLAAFAVTAAVASFGPVILAGYGAAIRLELLMYPLSFALGSATVALVATQIGAGAHTRARRIGWTAAALSSLLGLVFAGVALSLPHGWMALFTRDPAVIAAGAAYLRTMGLSYPVLGLGFGLVFALQGAGQVLWPFVAGAARLAVVAGGAWLVLQNGGSPATLYLVLADAAVLFVLGMLAASRGVLWRRTGAKTADAPA
jgi:putative MATE family efflux protein